MLHQILLDHPKREHHAGVQDPADGAWGQCYESWPLKLIASYDHRGDRGARPFRFLDRVNSPEKLRAYLLPLALPILRAPAWTTCLTATSHCPT